ncbi:cation acetate symporter [Nocardioides sp. SYSU DS0651]|uniref:sodium/solute symporter n=1 Tax=Nocardioides sp. SYSU DS0651 TaxID=3415955 RepID=UPI003F4CA1CC
MSTSAVPGLIAVIAVSLVTLAIGTWGLRFSRTTSDFFVASRTVRPPLNASAIGGEYLSAASFLGVAGLLFVGGAEMLWYPVGWTAGYLVLLVLVAAPLRRSGAYTLPDFAEARLGSPAVRAACSLLVVGVGWLYLVPQFEGAGITLHSAIGTPEWVGPVVVGAVVLFGVSSGGMRSITFVQAFQYWLKVTAILVPAAVLVAVWWGDGRPGHAIPGESWSVPVASGGSLGLYTTYSLIVALFLGTMGLPHVVVRFYTNPDGRGARRTTVVVLALLGLFYLWPPVYAALGRVYGEPLAESGRADVLVLALPRLVVDGVGGDVLTGLVTAGAFAAFLATASGLAIAVSGVVTQDLTSRLVGDRIGGVAAFRISAVAAVVIPVVVALFVHDVSVARAVGLAFAVAASTFCPLLVLGIWWPRLTDLGALAGLFAGGVGAGGAAVLNLAGVSHEGWAGALLGQPAAWSVPLAAGVMVLVSLATPGREPVHARRFLVRLHTPEVLGSSTRG